MKRELSRDTAGREGNTCNSEDQGEVGVVKAAKLVEHATASAIASASTSISDNASLQSSTSHNHHSGTGSISISSTGSDGVVTSGSGSGSGSKSTAATTPPKLLYFLIHKPREVLSDRIDSQVTLTSRYRHIYCCKYIKFGYFSASN